MKRSTSISAIPIDRGLTSPKQSFFDFIHGASTKTITKILVAVVITWVPAAILAAVQGWSPLNSFLSDVATQSRIFIVIPMLILAEPLVYKCLKGIAQHFITTELISDSDLPVFQASCASFKKLHDSIIAKIGLVLLLIAIVLSVQQHLTPNVLMPWTVGGGGWRYLSPAGVWSLWVINASVLYLFLLWLWRMMLWARFLQSVSQLNLRLIPAHPDRAAGLGFVETYIRKLFPFGFCVGVVVAGAVANQIIHKAQPLLSFKYMPAAVIVVVLLLCVAPLCVFMNTLLRAKYRGVFEYGALSIGMGQRFEKKWLRENVSEQALERQDFSATTDLYSITANVHQIRVVPVGTSNLYSLLVISLLPAIPVALIALPFDVLLKQIVKFVF